MSKISSKSDTNRNTILVIIIVLISAGVLSMLLYADYGYRRIDEKSDWISFTYHTEAGGWEFSFDSQYDNPTMLIKVKEPGWYNITYYYFNGNTESEMVYVCERFENITMEDGMILLQGEWSDGWIVINSFSYNREEPQLLKPGAKNLEKIEVNGEVGYFKTSLKNIDVDTGEIL